jgi:hypothetical protein|tara:strand:- start:812 stop:1030 length:219 start_codon:yes stop_codon:yes gene_type:complete
MKRKKASFIPATSFRVTKLKPNGPKDGQSTEAWERGKAKADNKWDKTREKNFNKLLHESDGFPRHKTAPPSK